MKIRTGFVTNSSSYCTAEVVIDNPVLLEILKKYKDDIELLSFLDIEDKVTFKEPESGGEPFADVCPTRLEEVVPSFMDAIMLLRERHEYAFDHSEEDKCKVLISEINEKRKEIEENFKSVKWEYSDGSYGEFYNNGSAKYSYCDGRETYEEIEGINEIE